MNSQPEIDEFYSIVAGVEQNEELVAEWRRAHMDRPTKAVGYLTTGIHLIDGEADFETRSITVLTEMGQAIELGFDDAALAADFDILVEMGEAEVVQSSVNPDRRIILSITDGDDVLSGEFDVFAINTLGFFDE